MLHLLLTPHDGGTAWRHALAAGEARAGWECVGLHGLARRVGRILGVAAETAPAPERIAAFTVRIDRDDDGERSYSASRQSDGFGVATYLLGLHDRLRLAGWSGGALAGSPRLTDLSRLEGRPEPVPPGLADVLHRLLAELPRRGALPAPLTIELAAPRQAFPALARTLLDALVAAGGSVTALAADAPRAPASSDLGRLQRAVLDPGASAATLSGDGSVLFLEADTALEAAELCGDLLRQQRLDETTVLLAAEPGVLDAALARQGLPTGGVPTASALRPHLQVLPLRLALAFDPQEPFRAAELLLLPGGPLPGFARRRLLAALTEMPGLWSPVWREAVAAIRDEEILRAGASGKDEASAAADGARLEARIEAWFGGERAEATTGLRPARAAAIVKEVAAWLGTRAGNSAESDDPTERDQAPFWSQAAAVAQVLQRMLLSRPADELLRPVTLMQLHAAAAGVGAERAAWPAQAGRPAVALHAAELLAGASTVVWWGFVQDAESDGAPDAWSNDERAALTAAGAALPEPGVTRSVEAWSWRRAVLAASRRVGFVRWRLAGAEVVQRHPFADELETRVRGGSLAACTVTSDAVLGGKVPRWEARTVAVPPAAPVRPRAIWRVRDVAFDGTQSASQLRTVLGCPLFWTLRYAGGLRPGKALEIPDDSRLLGDFAHRLLQDMLTGRDALSVETASDDDARAFVQREFDARVGTEAAPLVLRGREIERDRARRLVGDAAAALLRHLRAGSWTVVGAETELTGAFQGHPLAGRADLVLQRRKDGRRAVLDLKLSGFRYRHAELASGRGLQLALYASMLGLAGGKLPPAAYLLLDGGDLLSVTPNAFPGCLAVDGPALEETLAAAGETLARWKKAFGAGYVAAAIEQSGWEDELEPVVGPIPGDDEPGRYPPECRFCDFTTLCSVELGGQEGRAA